MPIIAAAAHVVSGGRVHRWLAVTHILVCDPVKEVKTIEYICPGRRLALLRLSNRFYRFF